MADKDILNWHNAVEADFPEINPDKIVFSKYERCYGRRFLFTKICADKILAERRRLIEDWERKEKIRLNPQLVIPEKTRLPVAKESFFEKFKNFFWLK